MNSPEEFDRTSRHLLAARAVGQLAPPGAAILDVGGAQGLTQRALPDYHVITVDVAGSVDVLASAETLPFKDDEFDVVLLLDVLEHLPTSLRSPTLEEATRVADVGLVVAGPFASGDVLDAENRAQSFYRLEMGRDHRWLEEHSRYGLPHRGQTKRILRHLGWSQVHEVSSNPIQVWSALQRLNFLVAGLGSPPAAVHQMLSSNYLDGGDADQPAYRHFLIACDQDLGAIRQPAPSAWTTDIALQRIDEASALSLGEARTEAQKRDRVLEQKGEALNEARRLWSTVEREKQGLQRAISALESDRLSLEQELADFGAQVSSSREEVRRLREELDASISQREHISDDLAKTRERLDSALADRDKISDALSRLRSGVGRHLKAIESSATWRIGRAITSPRRILRSSRPTSIDHLKTELENLPTPSTASSPPRDPITLAQTVVREIDALLSSRRMRLGNWLGNKLRPSGRGDARRADLRLLGIRDEIRSAAHQRNTHDLARLAEVAIRALERLESSRRWRIGSLAGGFASIVTRRRGTPATTRLKTSLPELTKVDSVESKHEESISEHLWGVNRTADLAHVSERYETFKQITTPERADEWPPVSAGIDGNLVAVIDCRRQQVRSLLELSVATTVKSLEEAGISDYRVWSDGPLSDKLPEDNSWVLILEPGDSVASGLIPGIAGISSDAVVFNHDETTPDGAITLPKFKPSFSPDWLLEFDYVRGAMAGRAEIWNRFAPDLDELNPPRDLLLRLWETGGQIATVDSVLVHKEQRTRLDSFEFTDRILQRRNVRGVVSRLPVSSHVRYELEGTPLISIVVPFKDRADLLRRCIESIQRVTTYPNYEIVLVDNQSREAETESYIESLTGRIVLVRFDEPFNYSRANNLGAAAASGEYIVFLNNDTEVLAPHWLEELVGHASLDGVGAVGAKLLFPNGKLQHAGVVIGLTGMAGHLLGGWHEAHAPPEFTRFTRNVTAVTGACLAIKKATLQEVDGFDEEFVLTGNDVDLCLRLIRAGYRNLWNPSAVLIHSEKESRKHIPTHHVDISLSLERYEPYLSNGDPYFSKSFSRTSTMPLPRTKSELSPSAEVRKPAPRTDRHGFVMRYDASGMDLQSNTDLMASFLKDPGVSLGSVAWFVPPFDHPYRGGIHTILRIATHLTKTRATRNRLIVCGESSWDPEVIAASVNEAFPQLDFEVLSSRVEGSPLPDADLGVATLWTTAYHLLRFNNTRGKYYLVQDFEPAFNQADATYGLVEQTYRFGFRGIANTPGVAARYAAYGSEVLAFVPGVDKGIYYPPAEDLPDQPVRIVFYGRPSNPRNGFELGIEALRKVRSTYGSKVEIRSAGAEFDPADWGVSQVLTNLGVLPNPLAVADLYRGAHIGLVFMFTSHPSYQPLEYMATGTVTVTNVNEANEWLLRHEENSLTVAPTASATAEAIGRLVDDPSLRARLSKAGLETVGAFDWDRELERIARYLEGGPASG